MKQKFIFFLSIALLLTAIPFGMAGYAEDETMYISVNILLDDTSLSLSPVPVQDTRINRVLVPIRPFCEATGMELVWNDADWSFVIAKDEQKFRFQIGNDIMYAGETETADNAIVLDAAPCLLNDRSFVPVRALSEGMGYTVRWNETTKTVSLSSPEAAATAGPVPTNTPAATPTAVPTATATATKKPSSGSGSSVSFSGGGGGGTGGISIKPSARPTATEEPVPTDVPSATGNTLTENLYNQMTNDENYMISPYSLKTALAMAAEGADGATKDELLQAAGIDDLNTFRQSFSAFQERMENYNSLPQKENSEFFLHTANSIWLNQQYLADHDFPEDTDFSDSFKNLMKESYFGTSQTLNGDTAYETVNDWISAQTDGRISDVLEDNEFMTALVNTLYMKANWQLPFSENNTTQAPFTQRDGTQAEVSMMHQTDTFSYYADDNLQAVQLPYAYAASMYIVLPEEGCNPVDFLSHIPEMESRKVALSLPKFQTESKFDLVPLLENMGVTSAFNFETADFSNTLNKSKDELPYRLDKVLQKTYIDLDESGTTATAATVITGVGGASPEDPVDFTADRPFTYFICDNATNEVLFMGEYAYAECV